VSDDELRTLILREVGNIAPEIDLAQIDPASNLREQVDLDSMDMLNLLIAIHGATGVDIPEADYAKMTSVDDAVAYLRTRVSH
jgi:acyl carrier protein